MPAPFTANMDPAASFGANEHTARHNDAIDRIIRMEDRGRDVTAEPTWDVNAANNDSAFASALTAVTNAGGGNVILPKLLKISQRHQANQGVNVRGRGGSAANPGSKILGTAAAARLAFGDGATARFGGRSGDFQIDGGPAGVDQSTIPMYVGADVARTFQNIDIRNFADTGLWCEGSQNCLFSVVNSAWGPTLYKLTHGAFTNVFDKCEAAHPSLYGVHFGTGDQLNSGGAVNYTGQNTFRSLIIEYGEAGCQAGVYHEAGFHNRLNHVLIAPGNANMATFVQMLKSGAGQSALFHIGPVTLTGVTGNTATAIDIGTSCSAIFETMVAITTIRDGIKYADNALVYANVSPLMTNVTNKYVGTAGFRRTAIRARRENPTLYTVDAVGDDIVQGFVAGEGNTRVVMRPDGMYYGDGVAAPLKIIGQRGAAVADAAGGATVDTEARAAINTLLARARAHGLIAP